MRSFPILGVLMCGLLLGGGMASAQDAPQTTPEVAALTGPEILKKSAAAYAALTTYSGTTTVVSKAEFEDSTLDQTAEARVRFERPGKMRVAGRDAGGSMDLDGTPFKIVSDGRKTWMLWELDPENTWEDAPSVERAVAAMTGVASGAPTTIPAALMNFEWHNPFANNEKSVMQGRETSGGFECYKVVQELDRSTRTLWVDTQNFLLRRLQIEKTEAQIAAAQQARLEADKKAGRQQPDFGDIPVRFKHSLDIETFAIESLNEPLDEALFQDPTTKK